MHKRWQLQIVCQCEGKTSLQIHKLKFLGGTYELFQRMQLWLRRLQQQWLWRLRCLLTSHLDNLIAMLLRMRKQQWLWHGHLHTYHIAYALRLLWQWLRLQVKHSKKEREKHALFYFFCPNFSFKLINSTLFSFFFKFSFTFC